MKKCLITLLIFIPFIANSFETVKDFEGIVTYSVRFIGKTKTVKTGKLSKEFGKKHLYYYKDGCHKWVSPSGNFEYEIYNPKTNPDLIVNKYRNSDTLYFINTMDSSETVSRETALDKEVICDKICRGVTFHLVNEKKKEVLKRTWYYASSGMEFGAGQYTRYKLMGQDYLVKYCGSIPLKIIMEWPSRPYYVIYEATNIEEIQLNDSEFDIDQNAPVRHFTN